jgi:hypothetical protein
MSQRSAADGAVVRRAWHAWGGWLAITAALGFLAVVVALHLAQPDYDPRHEPISALATGPWGEAMFPAFLLLALSLFGAEEGLRDKGASALPRLLLLAAAVMMLAAGIFPLGQASFLHVTVVNVGANLLVVAMYLLPSRAGRLRSRGLQVESWLLAAGTVASVVSVQGGVPLGVAQRLAVGCVLVWLCLLGRRLVRT